VMATIANRKERMLLRDFILVRGFISDPPPKLYRLLSP